MAIVICPDFFARLSESDKTTVDELASAYAAKQCGATTTKEEGPKLSFRAAARAETLKRNPDRTFCRKERARDVWKKCTRNQLRNALRLALYEGAHSVVLEINAQLRRMANAKKVNRQAARIVRPSANSERQEEKRREWELTLKQRQEQNALRKKQREAELKARAAVREVIRAKREANQKKLAERRAMRERLFISRKEEAERKEETFRKKLADAKAKRMMTPEQIALVLQSGSFCKYSMPLGNSGWRVAIRKRHRNAELRDKMFSLTESQTAAFQYGDRRTICEIVGEAAEQMVDKWAMAEQDRHERKVAYYRRMAEQKRSRALRERRERILQEAAVHLSKQKSSGFTLDELEALSALTAAVGHKEVPIVTALDEAAIEIRDKRRKAVQKRLAEMRLNVGGHVVWEEMEDRVEGRVGRKNIAYFVPNSGPRRVVCILRSRHVVTGKPNTANQRDVLITGDLNLAMHYTAFQDKTEELRGELGESGTLMHMESSCLDSLPAEHHLKKLRWLRVEDRAWFFMCGVRQSGGLHNGFEYVRPAQIARWCSSPGEPKPTASTSGSGKSKPKEKVVKKAQPQKPGGPGPRKNQRRAKAIVSTKQMQSDAAKLKVAADRVSRQADRLANLTLLVICVVAALLPVGSATTGMGKWCAGRGLTCRKWNTWRGECFGKWACENRTSEGLACQRAVDAYPACSEEWRSANVLELAYLSQCDNVCDSTVRACLSTAWRNISNCYGISKRLVNSTLMMRRVAKKIRTRPIGPWYEWQDTICAGEFVLAGKNCRVRHVRQVHKTLVQLENSANKQEGQIYSLEKEVSSLRTEARGFMDGMIAGDVTIQRVKRVLSHVSAAANNITASLNEIKVALAITSPSVHTSTLSQRVTRMEREAAEVASQTVSAASKLKERLERLTNHIISMTSVVSESRNMISEVRDIIKNATQLNSRNMQTLEALLADGVNFEELNENELVMLGDSLSESIRNNYVEAIALVKSQFVVVRNRRSLLAAVDKVHVGEAKPFEIAYQGQTCSKTLCSGDCAKYNEAKVCKKTGGEYTFTSTVGCVIGATNHVELNGITVLASVNASKGCSLSCLSKSAILHLLEHQTFSYPCCYCPLLDMIAVEKYNGTVDSVAIIANGVEVTADNKSVIQLNLVAGYDRACCWNGMLAHSVSSATYRNGVCACTTGKFENKVEPVKELYHEYISFLHLVSLFVVFVVCRITRTDILFVWALVGYALFRYANASECKHLLANLETEEGVAHIGWVSLNVGDCYQVDNVVYTVLKIEASYQYSYEARIPNNVRAGPSSKYSECGVSMECCETQSLQCSTGSASTANYYSHCQLVVLQATTWGGLTRCFNDKMVVRVEQELTVDKWYNYYSTTGMQMSVDVTMSYMGDDGMPKEVQVNSFKAGVADGVYLVVTDVGGGKIPMHVLADQEKLWGSASDFALKDMCFVGSMTGLRFRDLKCVSPQWIHKGHDVFALNFTVNYASELIGKRFLSLSQEVAPNSTSFTLKFSMGYVRGQLLSQGGASLGIRTPCPDVRDIEAKVKAGTAAYTRAAEVIVKGAVEDKCILVLNTNPCTILGDPSRLVRGEFNYRFDVLCGVIVPRNFSFLLADRKVVSFAVDGLMRDPDYTLNSVIGSVVAGASDPSSVYEQYMLTLSNFKLWDSQTIFKWMFISVIGYFGLLSASRGQLAVAGVAALVIILVLFAKQVRAESSSTDTASMVAIGVVSVTCGIMSEDVMHAMLEILSILSCVFIVALVIITPIGRCVKTVNRTAVRLLLHVVRGVCPYNSYDEWASLIKIVNMVILVGLVYGGHYWAAVVVSICVKFQHRTNRKVTELLKPVEEFSVEERSMVAQACQRLVPYVGYGEQLGQPRTTVNTWVLSSSRLRDTFQFCGPTQPATTVQCGECDAVCVLGVTHWVPFREFGTVIGQVVVYQACDHVREILGQATFEEQPETSVGKSGVWVEGKGVIVCQMAMEGKYYVFYNGTDKNNMTPIEGKLCFCTCEQAHTEWTVAGALCSRDGTVFEMQGEYGKAWRGDNCFIRITEFLGDANVPIKTWRDRDGLMAVVGNTQTKMAAVPKAEFSYYSARQCSHCLDVHVDGRERCCDREPVALSFSTKVDDVVRRCKCNEVYVQHTEPEFGVINSGHKCKSLTPFGMWGLRGKPKIMCAKCRRITISSKHCGQPTVPINIEVVDHVCGIKQNKQLVFPAYGQKVEGWFADTDWLVRGPGPDTKYRYVGWAYNFKGKGYIRECSDCKRTCIYNSKDRACPHHKEKVVGTSLGAIPKQPAKVEAAASEGVIEKRKPTTEAKRSVNARVDELIESAAQLTAAARELNEYMPFESAVASMLESTPGAVRNVINMRVKEGLCSVFNWEGVRVVIAHKGAKFREWTQLDAGEGTALVEKNDRWYTDASIAEVFIAGHHVCSSGLYAPICQTTKASGISGCYLGTLGCLSKVEADKRVLGAGAALHHLNYDYMWKYVNHIGLDWAGPQSSESVVGEKYSNGDVEFEVTGTTAATVEGKLKWNSTTGTRVEGLSGTTLKCGPKVLNIALANCSQWDKVVFMVRTSSSQGFVYYDQVVKIKEALVGTKLVGEDTYMEKLDTNCYKIRGRGVHPRMFGDELPVCYVGDYAYVGKVSAQVVDACFHDEVFTYCGRWDLKPGHSLKAAPCSEGKYEVLNANCNVLLGEHDYVAETCNGKLIANNRPDNTSKYVFSAEGQVTDRNLTTGLIGVIEVESMQPLTDDDVTGDKLPALFEIVRENPMQVYVVNEMSQEKQIMLWQHLKKERISMLANGMADHLTSGVAYSPSSTYVCYYDALVADSANSSVDIMGEVDNTRAQLAVAVRTSELMAGKMSVDSYIDASFELDPDVDLVIEPEHVNDMAAYGWWLEVFIMTKKGVAPTRDIPANCSYALLKNMERRCVVCLVAQDVCEYRDFKLTLGPNYVTRLYAALAHKKVKYCLIWVNKMSKAQWSLTAAKLTAVHANTAAPTELVFVLPNKACLTECGTWTRCDYENLSCLNWGRVIQPGVSDPAGDVLGDYEWNDHCAFWCEEAQTGTIAWCQRGVHEDGELVSAAEVSAVRSQPFWGESRIWIASLNWWGGMGKAFGYKNSLGTCQHVTRGNDIKYTVNVEANKQKTLVWDNGTQLNNVDVCTYNNFEFTPLCEGGVYVVLNPMTSEKIFLRCLSKCIRVNKKGEDFARLVPVLLDPITRTVRSFALHPPPGWSGLPIFNVNGDVCGVYGYGIFEHIQREDTMERRYVSYTLPCTTTIEVDDYFVAAARDVVYGNLENKICWLLEAPTGTGKTSRFVVNVINECLRIHSGSIITIALLEPMRVNVVSAHQLLKHWKIQNDWGDDVAVNFEMGKVSGQESSEIEKCTSTAKVVLTVQTYGKFNVSHGLGAVKVSYDLVLMDEAHMRRDPNILLTTLIMSKHGCYAQNGVRAAGSRAVVCMMSATPVSDNLVKRCCGSTQITGHKYQIETGVTLTEAQSNNVGSDEVILNLEDLGNSEIGGVPEWRRSWSVPKDVMLSGKVVIFADSVGNCKKLVDQIKPQLPGVVVKPYFSGCSISIDSLGPSFVLVSTDVLGVGITIVDLKVVIDLAREMKPVARLAWDDGLKYTWNNKPKKITEETAIQRRGRVGRTCPGAYITFKGLEYEQEKLFPEDMEPDLAWCAWQNLRYGNTPALDMFARRSIWSKVLEYKWIHPLAHTLPHLTEERWQLCQSLTTDPIALYFRRNISLEWEQKMTSFNDYNELLHDYKDQRQQLAWVRQYMGLFETTHVFDTEVLAAAADIKSGIQIDTGRAFYGGREIEGWCPQDITTYCKAAEVKNTLATAEVDLEESETSALTLVSVVCCTVAVLSTSIGVRADYSCDRYVDEICFVDKPNLRSAVRRADNYTVKDEGYWTMVSRYWAWFKRFCRRNLEKLRAIFGCGERKEDFEECMTSAESLFVKWIISAQAFGSGALAQLNGLLGTNFSYLAGLGVIDGLLWDKLNQVFGQISANFLRGIVYAALTSLAGLGVAGLSLGASLVTYIGKALIEGDNFTARLLDPSRNRRGCTLAFTGLTGVATGWLAMRGGLIDGFRNLAAGGGQSQIAVAMGTSRGNIAGAVCIVKHVYTLVRQLTQNATEVSEVRWDSIVAAVVSTVVHFAEWNPIKCMLAGFGGAMIALLQWACRAQRFVILSFLTSLKANFNSERYDEFLTTMDQTIPMLLGVAATVAEPLSLIPILLDVACQKFLLANPLTTKALAYEAFYHYSGIGPVVGVLAVTCNTMVRLVSAHEVRTADTSSAIALSATWLINNYGNMIDKVKHLFGRLTQADFLWVMCRDASDERNMSVASQWLAFSQEVKPEDRFRSCTGAELNTAYGIARCLDAIRETTGSEQRSDAVVYALRDMVPMLLKAHTNCGSEEWAQINSYDQARQVKVVDSLLLAIRLCPKLGELGWVNEMVGHVTEVAPDFSQLYKTVAIITGCEAGLGERALGVVKWCVNALWSSIKCLAKIVLGAVRMILGTTVRCIKSIISATGRLFARGMVSSITGGLVPEDLEYREPLMFSQAEKFLSDPTLQSWAAYFDSAGSLEPIVRQGLNLMYLEHDVVPAEFGSVDVERCIDRLAGYTESEYVIMNAVAPLPLVLVKISAAKFLEVAGGAFKCTSEGCYSYTNAVANASLEYSWCSDKLLVQGKVKSLVDMGGFLVSIAQTGTSESRITTVIAGPAREFLTSLVQDMLKPLAVAGGEVVTTNLSEGKRLLSEAGIPHPRTRSWYMGISQIVGKFIPSLEKRSTDCKSLRIQFLEEGEKNYPTHSMRAQQILASEQAITNEMFPWEDFLAGCLHVDMRAKNIANRFIPLSKAKYRDFCQKSGMLCVNKSQKFRRAVARVEDHWAHFMFPTAYLQFWDLSEANSEESVLRVLDSIAGTCGVSAFSFDGVDWRRSVHLGLCDCYVAVINDMVFLGHCNSHGWTVNDIADQQVDALRAAVRTSVEVGGPCDVGELMQVDPEPQKVCDKLRSRKVVVDVRPPEVRLGAESMTGAGFFHTLGNMFMPQAPKHMPIDPFIRKLDRWFNKPNQTEEQLELAILDKLEEEVVPVEEASDEDIVVQLEGRIRSAIAGSTHSAPWIYNFNGYTRGVGIVPYWVNGENIAPIGALIDIGELQDKAKAVRQLWDRWSKLRKDEEAQAMLREGRVDYPKRKIQVENSALLYASRGVCKAQQLHEFFTPIFEEGPIWDPCCGYGGFGQYTTIINSDRPHMVYYYSTLMQEKHAMPDLSFIQAEGSLCNAVRVGLNTSGDMRDPDVQRAWSKLAEEAPPRVVLFDVGEASKAGSLEKEGLWWYRERGGVHNLAAASSIISKLVDGGRAVVKMLGINSRSAEILARLVGKFARYAIYKMPTAGEASREWYIICDGYRSERPNRSVSFFRNICDYIELELIECNSRAMSLLKRSMNQIPKVHVRNDWVRPHTTVECRVYNPSERSKKVGEKYDFKVRGSEDFQYDWRVDYGAAYDKVLEELKTRKDSMSPRTVSAHRPWKNLIGLGSYATRGKPSDHPKRPANKLLATWAHDVAGWTPATGAYGWTQSTRKHTEMSYEARLDSAPNRPDPLYIQHLVETADTMYTESGKMAWNSCRLLEKDEVLSMLNMKGSTGRFCRQSTLKSWIAANPNWYELGLARIHQWENSERSGTYWTVRNKVESKLRKDVDEAGKIIGEAPYDTLLERGDMTPRQITFADEVTRIAHYILFGDMLNKHAANKLYYGSFNGLPPFRVGTALYQLWERAGCKQARQLCENWDDEAQVGYKGEFEERPDVNARAAMIDYSKFDFTQTVFDRMVECRFVSRFFPKRFQKCLENCFKEMAFRVMFNDLGDIWFLIGMRASGEMLTSWGNTFQASLHYRAALAKVLSRPVGELNKTIGRLTIRWGTETKVFEITPEMSVWDGDDGCHMTNSITAKQLPNMERYLTFGCKTIRSGTKSGMTVVSSFEQVFFCSHHYVPVLIGPEVSTVRGTNVHKRPLDAARELGVKVWWLPDRSDNLIVGKLPPTLKHGALEYDPANTESVELTRGKIVSYALLYPHHRLVRTMTTTLLSIIGDGKYTLHRDRLFSDDWREYSGDSLRSALSSVYGVENFRGLSTRPINNETAEWRALNHNASLSGLRAFKSFYQLKQRSMQHLLSYGVPLERAEAYINLLS